MLYRNDQDASLDRDDFQTHRRGGVHGCGVLRPGSRIGLVRRDGRHRGGEDGPGEDGPGAARRTLRRRRPSRAGGHARRAAAPLHPGGRPPRGLRRPPRAHRVRADHLPALHRRLHDVHGQGRPRFAGAGDRGRERLPGRGPGRDHGPGLHRRDRAGTGRLGRSAAAASRVQLGPGPAGRRLPRLGGVRTLRRHHCHRRRAPHPAAPDPPAGGQRADRHPRRLPFRTQQLVLVEKRDGEIRTKNLMPVRFVPFTGAFGE